MKKKTKAKPKSKPNAASNRSKRPTSLQIIMRQPLTTANFPNPAISKIPKVSKDQKSKSLVSNRSGKLLAESLLKPPVILPQ